MADDSAKPGNQERTGAAWWGRFQKLLDDQNAWPTNYVFKFIAPRDRLDELKDVFGQVPMTVRASRKGNYLSLTVNLVIHSSDEVVAIYTRAGAIEGVISL